MAHQVSLICVLMPNSALLAVMVSIYLLCAPTCGVLLTGTFNIQFEDGSFRCEGEVTTELQSPGFVCSMAFGWC